MEVTHLGVWVFYLQVHAAAVASPIRGLYRSYTSTNKTKATLANPLMCAIVKLPNPTLVLALFIHLSDARVILE